ncbi:MAG: inositol monophosphatase [Ferrovum sp. 37-45-19]|uniref:inositol monophosphatase family protein n=1 Tax=Ferrovum sp. JA12 TaxID=1356299 RepID=UPI00070371DC|nr:inositol monophosphatase family protein [Ferrovum sp. JA12]OYV80061.1 MAG: inositol monophosphatase [Ferrovum sp. 21-44-67]OYV93617.1 MAG: inositol monophosphatase [Ferrovum sp. 37-45-19]OZB33488.1 MAG: inositol monophosphatase [Ferrovum sp. 34-44-207]HQT81938.1 inositol monophosphatase family protein [Ferrovaceae bacterium]KRH78022.1 inositol-1-monophosphatase [Ferrovum sp. JA12]
MHPMLNTAIKAARRAGSIINRAALDIDRLKIARKGPADYVTEIDKAAEEAIISVLQEAYPDHSFLGEESGALGQSEYQWIIDPIDGTTNFLHGFPMYAVSIALSVRGVITQGVIYDPLKNDLFTATRGAGAFLNERRLRVSAQTRMEDALIGSGFPYSSMDNQERYLRMLAVVMRESAGIRRPGSAALDLAYVAAGRYDGFWELGLKPWDMAAGVLLIQEAGGLVTDLEGEQRYLETGHVVAATPKIFSQLLSLVTKA